MTGPAGGAYAEMDYAAMSATAPATAALDQTAADYSSDSSTEI